MTEIIESIDDIDNGLSLNESDEIDQLRAQISEIAELVAALPRHRSYSLAITKLDEARHWLNDRKQRTTRE